MSLPPSPVEGDVTTVGSEAVNHAANYMASKRLFIASVKALSNGRCSDSSGPFIMLSYPLCVLCEQRSAIAIQLV